ncbi:hypothetical protein [Nitrosomonas eutropha]|nr:hypothetical protein [Nitrosomonas eutropha]
MPQPPCAIVRQAVGRAGFIGTDQLSGQVDRAGFLDRRWAIQCIERVAVT